MNQNSSKKNYVAKIGDYAILGCLMKNTNCTILAGCYWNFPNQKVLINLFTDFD